MFENLRLAIQGIWSHKMRSFLTMLGIIIGIASIIAIVSTIQGTSEQIKEDLIGAGRNTVNITLYDGDSEAFFYDGSTTAPVISEDQKKKVRKLENVIDATFFYTRSWSTIYHQNDSFMGGTVLGVDSSYLDTTGYLLQTGRGFVPRDYERFSKVALIDTNVVESLFLGEDPLGEVLEIEQQPFTIVGVIAEPEDYLPKMETINDYEEYYQDSAGTVLIPDACWPIPYQFDDAQNAIIRADSTDSMSSAGKSAADILNAGINNQQVQKNNYSYKADDIMERVRSMQKLSESTSRQLIWIASISLLVGGIGVMNIMLVSVTERTSEIGLKKAIGARKRTILRQFLTEASMLTSIGGIIGVLSGIGLSQIVSRITGTPSAISVPAIVISVAFSTLIGVIFGLMPSVKASNLNPIDALRSE